MKLSLVKSFVLAGLKVRKMKFCLCVLIIGALHVTSAWFPSERCVQDPARKKRSHGDIPTVTPTEYISIEEIVNEYHEKVIREYANLTFEEVRLSAKFDNDSMHPHRIKAKILHSCKFVTHSSREVENFCEPNIECKLVRSVSTSSSYTSSDGYNWGAKVSLKFNLLEKVIEVGGEVSVGGTYTCSFTKGRTETNTVDCSWPTKPIKRKVYIYTVKSDMDCGYGSLAFDEDGRGPHRIASPSDSPYIDDSASLSAEAPQDLFSRYEVENYITKDANRIEGYDLFITDRDSLSSGIYHRILKFAPLFNPVTDIFLAYYRDNYLVFKVRYMAPVESTKTTEYRKIIPFTEHDGNAPFMHACLSAPFP